jgi:Sortase domain
MDGDAPDPRPPAARPRTTRGWWSGLPRLLAGSGSTRLIARSGLPRLLAWSGWARLGARPPELKDRRQRAAVGVLIVGLVLGATVGLVSLLGRSGDGPKTPPTPPRPVAAGAITVPSSAPAPTATASAPPPPTHCSTPAPAAGDKSPFRICIPALKVDASMMSLGLNPDRTVEVPPLSKVRDAGWYKYSAEPGAVGPTVILGHVDSAQYGDGVFFRLSRLHAGDTVVVSRADGMLATFRINRVSEVSKSHFPTDEVYGPTSGPALRLITCGGQFDSATRNYEDNIIAYGTLLSLRHR